jgi:YidC/Oxa1 family membrane protein insertase
MDFQNFGQDQQAPDMRRLLITVVVITGFVMAFNFLTRPSPEEIEARKQAEAAAAAQTEQPEATPDPVPTATPDPVASDVAATPALPESFAKVAIDDITQGQTTEGVRGGYQVDLSSKGGALSRFELTGYTDTDRADPKTGEAPNVDLAAASLRGARTMALVSRGGEVSLKADADYTLVKDEDGEVIYERTTPSGVVVRRAWRFNPVAFQLTHTVTLENKSSSPQTAELNLVLVGEERPGERDQGGFFGAYSDKLAAVCSAAEDREKYESAGLEEKQDQRGKVSYVAVDRHFFLGAVVPTQGETQGCTVEGWKMPGDGEERFGMVVTLEHAPLSLAAGESKILTHEAFFGPKQLGLLKTAGYQLEENVDFGWFGVISKPMLFLLVKMYDFTKNFGWAIILLTLLIKALTFPLTQKSYVNMQQMKTLQPELKALQKKYASDKAKLGQAQMDLYKERGINPMAGCFPMLVQMPIWFALYRTLWNSVELYQQPFLGWVTDLSQPDAFPLGGFPILPIVVGVLMFAQTALQPTPQDQPQMKYIMWGMPVFFSLLMLQMPSGLSVYMITNSMLTMVQQFYIRRKYGSPVVPEKAEEKPVEKAKPAATKQASSGSKKSGGKKKSKKKKS